MAYDPPADGDELNAALLLADVWDQVIAQVTSATLPPGTEGQLSAELDNNRYVAHDGSGFVEFGRWAGSTSWTPQIDQGATTNISKTTHEARYIRLGNLIFAWCQLSITAAGTAGSNLTVTLPVAPSGHSTSQSLGTGQMLDAGTAANSGIVDVEFNGTGSQVYFRFHGTASGVWGGNPNAAVASGDSIRFSVMYLVA